MSIEQTRGVIEPRQEITEDDDSLLPEQRLILATLERAVFDFAFIRSTSNKWQRSAERFLFSENRSKHFWSFRSQVGYYLKTESHEHINFMVEEIRARARAQRETFINKGQRLGFKGGHSKRGKWAKY